MIFIFIINIRQYTKDIWLLQAFLRLPWFSVCFYTSLIRIVRSIDFYINLIAIYISFNFCVAVCVGFYSNVRPMCWLFNRSINYNMSSCIIMRRRASIVIIMPRIIMWFTIIVIITTIPTPIY